MSKLTWIIFSVVVIGLFGGLIAWQRVANPPLDISGYDVTSLIGATDDNGNIGDHVFGNEDSKVIVMEYGDFQCPGCASAYTGFEELMTEYEDRVAFVFRNFPITSIHPNAKAAAAAAEAAGLQGKFWEMAHILYPNQSEWSSLGTSERTDMFISYAEELDLDIEKFTKDLSSANVSKKIEFDLALGQEQGVDATPTFFVNGEEADATAVSDLLNNDTAAFGAILDDILAEE